MMQRRRLRSVALVGLDGSGKSTQANLLVRLLKERGARVYSMHPYGRKLLRVGYTRPLLEGRSRRAQGRKGPGLTWRVIAALDMVDIWLYSWLVYLRALLATFGGSGMVWLVSDRSFDDLLVKHWRLGTLPERMIPLVRAVGPRFDTTIWVQVSPGVSAARDRDFDRAYYDKLYAAYSAAAGRFGWRIVSGTEPGGDQEVVELGPGEVLLKVTSELDLVPAASDATSGARRTTGG